MYMIGAVASIVVTCIVIILVFAWRKCIKRCIAIVRECCKVFRDFPSIVFYPVWGVLFKLGFVLLGVLMVMWTLDDAVWTKVTEDYGIDIPSGADVGVMLYCVFVAMWAVQFVKAISWTSIASCVGYWYRFDNCPGA